LLFCQQKKREREANKTVQKDLYSCGDHQGTSDQSIL
jgi:hypothetical protein